MPPVLRLKCNGSPEPLVLRCTVLDQSPQPELVVDQALMEGNWLADGSMGYRARFWLSRMRADMIRFSLPRPVREIILERVEWNHAEHQADLDVEDRGAAADTSVFKILCDPEDLGRPGLLDIRFRLPLEKASGPVSRTALPCPLLLGNTVIGPVRWLVEVAPDRVPLWFPSQFVAEEAWTWQGWLRPAAVERVEKEGDGPPAAPRLVWAFQGEAELSPLVLWHADRQAWLLAASVVVVAAGLVLLCFPSRWHVLWLGPVLGALLVIALFAPSLLMAMAFGVQPGLLALAVLVLWLWFRRQRWERRIKRLPGFSSAGAAGTGRRPPGLTTPPRTAAGAVEATSAEPASGRSS
jgi:hypothetical protein